MKSKTTTMLGRDIEYLIQLVRAGRKFIQPEATWEEFEQNTIKELIRLTNTKTRRTDYTEEEFWELPEYVQTQTLKCFADSHFGPPAP